MSIPSLVSVVDQNDFALFNNPNYLGPGQPFVYGGNLYLFLQFGENGAGGNPNYIYAYQSRNGGQSWQTLDAAAAPLLNQGSNPSAFFDGNHTVTVAVINPVATGGSASLFLQQFNLATGLWGAAFATGGPTVKGPTGPIFVRPDGSILVTYDTGNNPAGGKSNFLYTIWNGAAWSAPADAGAAFFAVEPATRVFVAVAGGAMDPAGNVNLFFSDASYVTIFWQQILAGSAGLGNSFQFTAPVLATSTGAVPYGSPVIIGSQIVWPVAVNSLYTAVFVGNSLTVPVFTLSAAIDSHVPTGNPAILFDTTNNTAAILMQAASNTSGGFSGIFRTSLNTTALTSALTGWQTPLVSYDYDINPPPNPEAGFGLPGWAYIGYNASAGIGYMVGDSSTLVGGGVYNDSATFFGTFSLSTTFSLEITLRGVKRRVKMAEESFCEAPQIPHVKIAR